MHFDGRFQAIPPAIAAIRRDAVAVAVARGCEGGGTQVRMIFPCPAMQAA